MSETRGTRLALGLMLVGTCLGSALRGPAQESVTEGSPTAAALFPRVNVRVYNYDRVNRRLLDRAEQETNGVFRQAGIGVGWTECPRTEAEIALYPDCQGPPASADFVLNLLPESMARHARLQDSAFGFAVSQSASVFCERIDHAAQAGGLSAYQLLGHAVAHEIGHLLLGPGSHTEAGLMDAAWGPEDLVTMGKVEMFFTPQQSERMRAEARLRIEKERLGARTVELAQRVALLRH